MVMPYAKRGGPPLCRLHEGSVHVLGSANLKDLKLQLQSPRAVLHFIQHGCARHRIVEDRYARRCRERLMEVFQPLSPEFGFQRRDTGDVASWLGQAVDEPRPRGSVASMTMSSDRDEACIESSAYSHLRMSTQL